MCDQQATTNQQDCLRRPMQRSMAPQYADQQDNTMRSGLYLRSREPLPLAPLNYKGREFHRPPSGFDTDRTWTPSGISGRYEFKGPFAEPAGVRAQFSMR